MGKLTKLKDVDAHNNQLTGMISVMSAASPAGVVVCH
jgi:hypothetical protein